MEFCEEIKNRMLTLKKRLREPDMKEIFDLKPRSIIEIYNKKNKKPEGQNKCFQSSWKDKGAQEVVTTHRNVFNSYTASTNASQVAQVLHESSNVKSEIELKGESTIINSAIYDEKMLRGSSSSGSGKGSKKRLDDKSKGKLKTPVTKPIQRPPPKNLLNMDQWKMKSKNETMTDILNVLKKEITLPIGEALISTNQVVENIEINPLLNDIGSASEKAKTNINISLIDPNLKETQHQEKSMATNHLVVNAGLESSKNIIMNVDDSFFDHRDELFDHTLPPEVMGETPEFQKEDNIDEMEEMNNIENTDQEQIKTEQLIKYDSVSVASVHSNNKIVIPNMYTNEKRVPTANPTTNRKPTRIIDDEEEEANNCTYINHISGTHINQIMDNDNTYKFTNGTTVVATSNKIKISLFDVQGIISPSETKNKSVKSSRSIEKDSNKKDKSSLSSSNKKDENMSVVQSENKFVKKEKQISKADIVEVDKKRLNCNVKKVLEQSNKKKKDLQSKNEESRSNDNQKVNSLKSNTLSNIPIAPNFKNNGANTKNQSTSREEISTTNVISKIPYVHQDNMKELLENDIKKVNNTTYYVTNIKTAIDAIQKKLKEVFKKNISDQEIQTEFDTIVSVLESIKEDSSIKGIKQLIEKATRIIIKLLGLLGNEDNSEQFLVDIIEILDYTNDVVKKKLSLLEGPVASSKIIKYLKIALKFIGSVSKLKTYKQPKLKQLSSEIDLNLKDTKRNTDMKSSLISLLKFSNSYKTYSSTLEKMNKILKEIKKEDDEKNKNKKQKSSSDFQKTYEKIKKLSRTTINYLSVSKSYTLLKNLNDLITTYFRED